MWRAVSFPFFPAMKSWCSCLLLSVASSTVRKKETQHPYLVGMFGCFVKKICHRKPEVSTLSKFLGVFSTLLLNSTCFAGEKKGSMKGSEEEEGWYHRCKSQLRPPALGRWFAGWGWNFEGRCQWKPNRSGWKGLKVSLLYTQSFSSYSLRMFEAGKDVCWPVTWEMVAPELGEVRSFILQNNFSSLRCHFQQLVELVVHQWRMFLRKAVSGEQLMSMYSGSMSFKINSTPCYSIQRLHTKDI